MSMGCGGTWPGLVPGCAPRQLGDHGQVLSSHLSLGLSSVRTLLAVSWDTGRSSWWRGPSLIVQLHWGCFPGCPLSQLGWDRLRRDHRSTWGLQCSASSGHGSVPVFCAGGFTPFTRQSAGPPGHLPHLAAPPPPPLSPDLFSWGPPECGTPMVLPLAPSWIVQTLCRCPQLPLLDPPSIWHCPPPPPPYPHRPALLIA